MSIANFYSPASRKALLNGVVPPWIRNNKRARYIAAVCISIPPWVTRKELHDLKKEAARITKETGHLHVLAHIVPVNNSMVCGLTVPWNLEIQHWKRNNADGNYWNPDQIEMFEIHIKQTPET